MLTLKPHKVYSIRLLTRSLDCCSLSPRKPEELVAVEVCWKHKSKLASDKFKAMWGESLATWGAPHLNIWATNGREMCWALINTGTSALFQVIPEGGKSWHVLLAWLLLVVLFVFWEVLPHQICVEWMEPAPALSHPCNTVSCNLKAHPRTGGRLLSCTECCSDLVRVLYSLVHTSS